LRIGTPSSPPKNMRPPMHPMVNLPNISYFESVREKNTPWCFSSKLAAAVCTQQARVQSAPSPGAVDEVKSSQTAYHQEPGYLGKQRPKYKQRLSPDS
jgi:hypothetical protein